MTLHPVTPQIKKPVGSTLISHNVMVNGHRTSVRLEKEMWLALKDVAKRESCSLHDVVSEIATHKTQARPNLAHRGHTGVYASVFSGSCHRRWAF